MLLLDTTMKAYMGSPMTLSYLTLSDLDMSKVTEISKQYISERSKVMTYVTTKR